MLYDDLTPYQKRRVTKCIYCGRDIKADESFKMLKEKQGRCVIYFCIHDDCVNAAMHWLKNNERRLK